MDRATLNSLGAWHVSHAGRRLFSLILLCHLLLPAVSRSGESTAERHYTVIGAVREPQTLTFATPTVQLDELLESVGGLTPSANGFVRIVHEHGNEWLNVSGGAGSEQVPAGAVVVAVGKPDTAEPGRIADADQHVACINLWDHPAVCRLPANQSTPEALAQSLGLPTDTILAAKRINSTPSRNGPALASGTVIDFAGVAVDRQALKAAPSGPPQHTGQTAEHQTAVAGHEAVAEPNERSLPQNFTVAATPNAPLAVSQSFTVTPDSTTDDTSTTVGLFGEPVDEAVIEVSQLNDWSSAVVPAAIHAIHAEIPLPPSEARLPAELEGPDATTLTSAPRSAPLKAAGRLKQRAASPSSWIPAIAISFLALGGLAVAIAWSHRERNRRRALFHTDETPAEMPESRATDSVLQELINDSLPILLEDPRFPDQPRIYGRVVGFRHLILHHPHQARGPHLLRRRTGDGSRPAAGQVQALGTRRTDDAPPSDIAQARASATVPRDVPASATPLERALWMHRTGGDA